MGKYSSHSANNKHPFSGQTISLKDALIHELFLAPSHDRYYYYYFFICGGPCGGCETLEDTSTQLKTAEVHVWSCTLPQAVFEEKCFLLRRRRNMPHYISVIDIMQF